VAASGNDDDDDGRLFVDGEEDAQRSGTGISSRSDRETSFFLTVPDTIGETSFKTYYDTTSLFQYIRATHFTI
jgi:hypothetical protein